MIELEYFTGPDCGVCQVLKPKLVEAVQLQFPTVKISIHDVTVETEYAAQQMVFTLPVVLIKVDGKELYRFARSFSVNEVLSKLDRITSLSSI
ncbi:MAG: thioredoxin family protein [Crocinitomicaceae bacterium]|nr:thioredoxin family protein [Crocinitomicaceae bacterium]